MTTDTLSISLIDRYMQATGGHHLLSAEEEYSLAQRVAQGDRAAREQMIMSNLRLVVKIAYDYAGMGVPLIDLISEGNIGLIKAVDRFSPHKGGRLATYAAWWIRQMIKQALAAQGKMIRLPLHMVDKIARLRRTTADLRAQLGREPKIEEIARMAKISVAKATELKALSGDTQSLQSQTPENISLQDTLPDDTEQTPLQNLLQKTLAERIRKALQGMEERQATILRLRHGLDGARPHTLDEVGHAIGLTRERVRQLEAEGQTQLRRTLLSDDTPLSRHQAQVEARGRQKIEVLRQFMIEKGILK